MSEDRAPLLQPGANNAPPPYYPAAGAVGQPAGAVGAPAGAVPPGGLQKQHPPAGAYQGGYGTYSGPPGYQPASQQPTYMQPGSSVTVVSQQPSVIIVGGCPACRIGVLEDDFTCLGVCCAILFFPLGLLCCFLLRQKRCPNCGAVFG